MYYVWKWRLKYIKSEISSLFYLLDYKVDMLQQQYIEKTVLLFYVVVCHLFVNDTGGTRVWEKIAKCDMGEGGFKKYHFADENGCLK